MTGAEVEQMREEMIAEVREVLAASRLAGDVQSAARLRAAALRLAGLAGSSNRVLAWFVDEVLEDERAGGAA